MNLVTTKKILKDAQEGNYSVGAFNVENMEMVMAVIIAVEEMKVPVIMQTTLSTVKYTSLEYFLANAKVAASKASVPVAIHLDHGSSFELVSQVFRAGYTSIMIEGFHEDFETNLNLTKSVVDMCLSANICVEPKLGKVGGKEDDLDDGYSDIYTDPLEVK